MPTYAIGDIQGCFDQLQQLLERIEFDPGKDEIWFTGDLVNRGPKSLETVRFVKRLGKSAVTVLGNHDLHLMAVDAGVGKLNSGSDTLADILAAPDREELMLWLRGRPLIHHDAKRNAALLHAGLPPQWEISQAIRCAREVETTLRGPNYRDFLRQMYGNKPDRWHPDLQGWERLRFITNCFTRMRYCRPDGRIDLRAKGRPGTQPDGLLPWFELPDRKSRDTLILFGHWSTLGFHQTDNICALDTGCLWGGRLTTLCLDDSSVHAIPCPTWRNPG